MGQNLKDSIKAFLKQNNLEDKLAEVSVKASWKKLMGTAIDGHTTSIVLRNKKLHLTFDSAVLKQELSYSKSKVIQQMNEELGDEVIEEIIIR